ncbi:hypothetical protein DY78_GL000986 [Lactiplantibacillus fabifermentans DSM 21115]|uniref:Uncharacterized protein n=1 Tax=Lactiplantibacillus fabifermentans DSM 21115 TaxID=1413187 RepID=A0A0R2NKS9_9LACO|nr:hypothetical protein DY78_GL000986 [Lactiplantibacillus fabifermentans DSM 21115]
MRPQNVVAPFLDKNQFSCGSAVMEVAVQVALARRFFVELTPPTSLKISGLG